MRRYFISNGYLAALVAVAMGLASGLSLRAVAEEQDAGRPLLSDLMVLTQLRHFKLWYAQRVGNWKLAAYELDQLETTIGRIVKLYPAASSISQANLIHEKTDPALSDIRRAISDRSSSRFEAAYMQITGACNQCHQAAGVGFIVVRVPTKSPFGNQIFTPVH